MAQATDLNITKILVVGFGEIGRNVTEKIKNSRLPGVNTVCIDSGEIALRYDETCQPDTFNGAEVIIIVFDSAVVNEGLDYIAKNARKKGILVLGIATKSFFFNNGEDKACSEAISAGMDALNIVYKDRTVKYNYGEQALYLKCSAENNIIKSIKQLILVINDSSVINLNPDDFRSSLKNKSIVHIGHGYAIGDDKIENAVRIALDSCPHTPDISLAARFICIVSGDITLTDASDACDYNRELSGEDKDIIFRARYDESLEDYCSIMVIATDFIQYHMN